MFSYFYEVEIDMTGSIPDSRDVKNYNTITDPGIFRNNVFLYGYRIYSYMQICEAIRPVQIQVILGSYFDPCQVTSSITHPSLQHSQTLKQYSIHCLYNFVR